MEREQVLRLVEQIREEYGRDVKRYVRQQRMDLALLALGGEEACEKVARWLEHDVESERRHTRRAPAA